MDFKEKLKEILGEDNSDKVEAINKAIPEVYVLKSKYNEMSTRAKNAESKVSEFETEIENNKNSKLTDQEKLTKEIAKAQATQKEYATKSNRLEAEKIFVNAGLKNEDYIDFIDGIVSDNLEITKKYAESFAKTITKTKESAEKSMQDKLLQETPRPNTDVNQPTEITKEVFDSMKYSEQIKFSQTNPTKYNEFTQQ